MFNANNPHLLIYHKQDISLKTKSKCGIVGKNILDHFKKALPKVPNSLVLSDFSQCLCNV